MPARLSAPTTAAATTTSAAAAAAASALLVLLLGDAHTAHALDNGLALTPPMGWANWNSFGCDYNSSTIMAQADALNASGLAAAGYRTIIIQECITQPGHRDAQGVPQPDPVKFPGGIKPLCDYVHSKGLLCGICECESG
jgi:alpha-galactosidase